jgi:hypothetical protein
VSVSVIIVLILRLSIPLLIFKNRIAGAIASMVIDMLDVVLVDALQAMPLFNEDQEGFGDNYQRFDKWLDMYYLTIEAYITFSWRNKLARNAAIALFIFRFLGIGIFEVTGEEFRKLIFFFPNLFENFFLYYIICDRFWPRLIPKKPSSLFLVLVLLYIPKFFQEYILHYSEIKPWQWIRSNILLTRMFF